ncbi:MAG TPA: hypothetical protein VN914_10430 [Polyangia bacterium]|nr:hypothetical protein [Polyangia bacterium]
MRAGKVAALAGLALAAGALGLSCKTYKDQGEVLPPGYEAGVYTPPPDRQVFDDGGLIRGGGGGSMGGMGVLNNDGGNPAADATSGGGQDQGGGGVVLDAGADGSGSCDLLMQTCGPQRGCYPGPAGGGRCLPSEGFAEGVQCAEAPNCAAGLTCINNVCTPLCSTVQNACTGGRRCVTLPATDGVGYCLP